MNLEAESIFMLLLHAYVTRNGVSDLDPYQISRLLAKAQQVVDTLKEPEKK